MVALTRLRWQAAADGTMGAPGPSDVRKSSRRPPGLAKEGQRSSTRKDGWGDVEAVGGRLWPVLAFIAAR